MPATSNPLTMPTADELVDLVTAAWDRGGLNVGRDAALVAVEALAPELGQLRTVLDRVIDRCANALCLVPHEDKESGLFAAAVVALEDGREVLRDAGPAVEVNEP